MPKGIDRYVSENRSGQRRIDATFIEVSGERGKNLNFLHNLITPISQAEIQTRDLNNSLISGHSNGDAHGSGVGESGDQRGTWTTVEEVISVTNETLTVGGQNAIKNLLAGEEESAIEFIAVGTGGSDPVSSQQILDSETGSAPAFTTQGSDSDENLTTANFLYNEVGNTLREFGLVTSDQQLFNRVVSDSNVNKTIEEEFQVKISVEILTDELGDTRIPNTGRDVIAEAIRNPEDNIQIAEIKFGDGSSPPSVTDTDLDNPLFSEVAEVQQDPQTAIAHSVLVRLDPSNQPVDVSEIGVYDNRDNLIWRAVVEEFTKTEEFGFEVFVGFRVKDI